MKQKPIHTDSTRARSDQWYMWILIRILYTSNGHEQKKTIQTNRLQMYTTSMVYTQEMISLCLVAHFPNLRIPHLIFMLFIGITVAQMSTWAGEQMCSPESAKRCGMAWFEASRNRGFLPLKALNMLVFPCFTVEFSLNQ